MKKVMLAAFLGVWIICAAAAQEVLTNESIVKMVSSGLGESLVISVIQNQPGQYVITPADLLKLKQAGVSEKVLAAMVNKGSASATAAAGDAARDDAPTVAPTAPADLPQNVDIGVYARKGGQWEELMPEIVNWKTGGVFKHTITGGIIKGDVNGNIPGMHSRNSLKSPVEVVVYAPEGVAITEYQLIRLRENRDDREFRTVTGGILHESGGVTRDLVPFEGKKVASRMYKVVLPILGAGEYGFLPPEAVTLSKGASVGKMYTFRLLE